MVLKVFIALSPPPELKPGGLWQEDRRKESLKRIKMIS